GKTNLLEAIELLATTKSARAGTDRELIHWAVLQPSLDGGPVLDGFARMSAVVQTAEGETRAEVVVRIAEGREDASASKLLRLNGLPRRAVDFVGEINVVTFSPEDVML